MNRERLFRQPDLLAQNLHARIAAQEGQFRECEGPSESNRSERDHGIQSFESAVFVTQTSVDQNALLESPFVRGCKPLRFLAAAGPSIGVGQPTRKPGCFKNLNCLANSAFA